MHTPPEELSIAEMLEALAEDLSRPPSSEDREQRAAEVQRQLDAIINALLQWIQALDDDGSGIDSLTLEAVGTTLRSTIGRRLAEATAGDDKAVAETWASMAAVCTAEREAIMLLSRVPDALKQVQSLFEPPMPAWTITLRRCTVKDGRIRTEYTRPDRPGVDTPQGIRAWGLSTALAFLRLAGIRRLVFINTDDFTAEALAWLANSARKVFLDCDSRTNLVVNTTVCVPDRDVTMYTHLSFFASGTCHVRFESDPILVMFGAGASVQLEKAALVQLYELTAITEQDGGAWSVIELHQLGSALAKMPGPDREILRGMTFVRKKAAPTDDEMTQEAGSYRFADRTITLLDASFATDDYGFVGTTDAIGPYSHWTMLHELGHAVEKFSWEKDYRQRDTTAMKIEREMLEARKEALKQSQGGLAGGTDTKSLIRELEQQVFKLNERILEYTTAQAEMVNALRRNRSSSKCLQAFVRLVDENRIIPCTGYAYVNWKDKHGEFFAEAYSLFLNEPRFLAHISQDLYNWFKTGAYRASWQ